MSWSSEAREERLNAYYDEADIIDTRTYNLVLGGVVLEGLVLNYILCLTVGNVFDFVNPAVFYIGYFALAFLGIFISRKSNNPFISFIGYNMVVVPCGLVVSTTVYFYGGVESALVTNAFLYTAIITVTMIALSMVFQEFFASLGRVLFGCLIGALVAGIVCLLMGFDSFMISFFCAVLFSLYIGFDFWRSQQFEKTYDNAVDSAVDIYLDIINLFLRILRILGRSSRRN